jgi:hypothetical protein
MQKLPTHESGKLPACELDESKTKASTPDRVAARMLVSPASDVGWDVLRFATIDRTQEILDLLTRSGFARHR